MRRSLATLFSLALTAAFGSAQIIDGTRDAAYGTAVSVQAIQTQFGDAAPPGNLGGSELDAAYATVSGGRLNLMLTGNLEPNFNKLEVFIDSVAGGENTLSSTPAYDFNGGGGWISASLGGMTFDGAFSADYHLFARWGGGGTGPFEVDFVNRMGGGNAMVPGSSGASPNASSLIALGQIDAGDVGPNASGSALTQDLLFAINDNNAGGVIGGTDLADTSAALAVTTGMEFSIALADLGNPTPGSVIRIAAMINNGDHNYLSNQILGPIVVAHGNLGGGTANNPGCASSWSRWARSSASLVAVRTMPRSLSRAAKAT